MIISITWTWEPPCPSSASCCFLAFFPSSALSSSCCCCSCCCCCCYCCCFRCCWTTDEQAGLSTAKFSNWDGLDFYEKCVWVCKRPPPFPVAQQPPTGIFPADGSWTYLSSFECESCMEFVPENICRVLLVSHWMWKLLGIGCKETKLPCQSLQGARWKGAWYHIELN